MKKDVVYIDALKMPPTVMVNTACPVGVQSTSIVNDGSSLSTLRGADE